MTAKEVREYFCEIRDEQAEVEHLIEMITKRRASLLPSGICYDKDKIQTSPEDSLAKAGAEIADMTDLLDAKIIDLRHRRGHAERLVEGLKRAKEREVMRYYYLDSIGTRNTWDVVSLCIGYNKRQTARIHSAALENIAEIINKGA